MDDGVDVSIPQLHGFLSDYLTSEPLVKVGKAPNVTKKVVDLSTPVMIHTDSFFPHL